MDPFSSLLLLIYTAPLFQNRLSIQPWQITRLLLPQTLPDKQSRNLRFNIKSLRTFWRMPHLNISTNRSIDPSFGCWSSTNAQMRGWFRLVHSWVHCFVLMTDLEKSTLMVYFLLLKPYNFHGSAGIGLCKCLFCQRLSFIFSIHSILYTRWSPLGTIGEVSGYSSGVWENWHGFWGGRISCCVRSYRYGRCDNPVREKQDTWQTATNPQHLSLYNCYGTRLYQLLGPR